MTAGSGEIAATVVPGGKNFVGFDFGREVAAGPAKLTINYTGKLDPIETEGLFHQQYNGDWYVFNQFESVFARRAFPSFDEPSYRAVWQLSLTVPSGLVAVSNTPVASETPAGEGLKRVEFEPTLPIPSYLVALGVGPFEFVDGGTWGRNPTPVRIVVPKGQSAKAAFAAEVTGSILAWQEEYFDLPYAFGKLDYLVIPFTVGFGAMENPGLVTYAERGILIDPAAASLERLRRYASTAAHENAHMWFGDYVTMRWWDDIWLNEGFASWMGAKTVIGWRSEWWNDEDIFSRRGWALGADSRPTSRQVRRQIQNTDDIETAFDGISYGKGSALLQMFESWMGEATFRDAVRGYLRKHALGNATSDDFLAALAEHGGHEVKPSFASFLDQPGLPVVRFETDCPAGAPARLVLSQQRYRPLGVEYPAGSIWSIPVDATYGAGERSGSVRIVLDEPRESAQLPFCPKWISGNANGVGYYISHYGDLLDELAARVDRLPGGEQMTLLSDASMLVGAGTLAPPAALELLPRFTASPQRSVVSSAVTIARSVDSHLVAEEMRPNYGRFLAGLFGARTRELGWAPKPGEDEQEALLRPTLVGLLGDEGEDAAIRDEARRLAARWLDDSSAVDPSLRGTVLNLAALDGDEALFDRFLERAKATEDRRERGDLLAAVGHFRAPALVERALGLLLTDVFDLRESATILAEVAGDRRTRDRAFTWIRENWDAFAPKIPEQWRAGMTRYAAGVCDLQGRKQVEEFFGPRLENVAQGPTRLEQTLSGIDLCIARKTAQQAAVSEF
ncbi:MAG TPA: M1 family aminopeptidase, partial [Thermoanaerobaculia bacterium]|nr:M1 family aminopeptidase [Thermoanaerobaculia bacterium]